jgi:hypothetical protein
MVRYADAVTHPTGYLTWVMDVGMIIRIKHYSALDTVDSC